MLNKELVVEIFCPTGQDAFLVAEALKVEKIASFIIGDASDLLNKQHEAVDVILVAEEALSQGTLDRLNNYLLNQEPWSEIPVILLTSKGTRSKHFAVKRLEDFIYSGYVTLLERPLRPLSLISAVKVAIRSRKRQFQVRDLLVAQIEATKIRDEFISIAGHELKTPLTSLKLQTQVSQKTFQKSGPDINRMFKQLDYTLNQINRLDKLVDDMLDISRIGSGKLRLDKKTLNLSELLNDLVERFLPQFEAVGCSVTTDIEEEVIGLLDAYKIEQVMNNLFSNAIRYAPRSAIEISLRKDQDKALLVVKDEGQGIKADSLEKIFERFERDSANISGLGLGLYITKQIIQLHNGSIKVESQLTKGSKFIIELPL